MNPADDLDSSSSDLSRDIEGLKERCFSGFHAGVSRLDEDIQRSESTSSSRGLNFIGYNRIANLLEVGICEDEADITLNVRKELLILRKFGDHHSDCATDHGILPHENNSFAAKS